MLMRKFIFFLTLLGTAFGLSAAEAPDAVRVTPVTGEPIVFMFSANPEITYTATGATISTTSQDPVTFDFEAIEFIDFVKYGSVNEIAGTPVEKEACSPSTPLTGVAWSTPQSPTATALSAHCSQKVPTSSKSTKQHSKSYCNKL